MAPRTEVGNLEQHLGYKTIEGALRTLMPYVPPKFDMAALVDEYLEQLNDLLPEGWTAHSNGLVYGPADADDRFKTIAAAVDAFGFEEMSELLQQAFGDVTYVDRVVRVTRGKHTGGRGHVLAETENMVTVELPHGGTVGTALLRKSSVELLP